ncbi:MAG: hypothetical protein ACLFUR_03670 [Candidatus Hadarchaeia archaeon]
MIEIGYVIIGMLMFFIPGFFLSLLIFPGSDRLDFLERIGTSFGLGALIIILTGIILAQPTLRALRLIPFLASVFGFSALCAVLVVIVNGSRQALMEFMQELRLKK